MDIYFRPLCDWDRAELVALHVALFPINYEEGFYNSALGNEAGFFTLAAIQRRSDGQEAMVGFLTARLAPLHTYDPADRAYMGLETRLADGNLALYILTIGTAPQLRGQGIASDLLSRAMHHAAQQQAAAVFLHVITHNQAAIAFYSRNGFAQAALLKDFYYIKSDRQPDPNREIYDAYLYMTRLDAAAIGQLNPWTLMQAAASPFRDVWSHVTSYLQPMVRAAGVCWNEREGTGLPSERQPDLSIVGTSVAGPDASSVEAAAADSATVCTRPSAPWLTRLFARQTAASLPNSDAVARM